MKLRDNPAAVLSPYLQDHLNNPVDWWSWGADAFAEAAARDVPVMLSVGYAACHWCHVMAHESFEDHATADFLNQHFVCIKVDREERPDVDSVYMQVTQDLTGHGGWPMTVFLDPSGNAFYAGTYYPPQPRGGMPSFRQILEAVVAAWSDRRDEVAASAAGVTAALDVRQGALPGAGAFDESVAHNAVTALRAQFDDAHAGFGRAPKFPPSNVLQFLARHVARTGNDDANDMLARTCRAMAYSGMYDQVGGGFARYAVDTAWVVPHFEKMLYDNALLISVYTAWARLTDDPLPARIVRQSVEFLLAELRTAQGAFASALDADSEGREGAYYVWTQDELADALEGDDAHWAAEVFAVTADGTFEEGASTLQMRPSLVDDEARLVRVRARLHQVRNSRPRPARDDKVVTAWNGLVIAALAEAGAVFERPDWIAAASDCAEFIWNTHVSTRDDETIELARLSRDGLTSEAVGVLEDYGDLAQGLLLLYFATGDVTWADRVGELLRAALTYFAAPDGGFFDTASDAETLISRPRDPSDAAYPSGASALVGALVSYAALTGSSTLRAVAERALDDITGLVRQAPRFAGWWLAAGEAVLDGPREVAIAVPPDASDDLTRTFWATPTAGAVLARGATDATGAPLLASRPLVDGRATAYVCRDFVCLLPVTEAADLAALLTANT